MKGMPIFEEVFIALIRQRGAGVKLLIGGLLSFVPIVNLLAFGYLYRFVQRIRRTGDVILPEWSDWRGLFFDGLRFGIVWVAYWLLPVMVASMVASMLSGLGIGALAYLIFSLTFLIAPILFASALYRYLMRSDLKDLLDVQMIVKMTYLEFPRFLVPAIAYIGLFTVLIPLYGLALFVSFAVILAHTALCFRNLEYHDSVSF